MSTTLRSCVRALTDAIARAGAAPVTHVELTRASPPDETDAAFADARTLIFTVIAPGGVVRMSRIALTEPTLGADLSDRLNTLLEE